VAVYGAAGSVSTSVQVPVPAGERWKVTVLTVPGAVSEAVAARATELPRRSAPAAGAVSVPLGRVRSTVASTSSVAWRPAPSVARTRISRAPSDGIGHATPYGAVVSSPRGVHVSEVQVAEVSLHCSKLTEAIPVPVSSAIAVTGAGSAVARLTGFGTLAERVGAVLSTVTVIAAEAKTLPALSVVTTRRS
jgi:hypothetical protein